MAQFSGVVKISDVNDFIAPSQACVLNLDGSNGKLPVRFFYVTLLTRLYDARYLDGGAFKNIKDMSALFCVILA
jgi:hypothetical protein